MDKKAFIAIALSIVTLVVWQMYYVRQYQPPAPAEPPADAVETPRATAPATPATGTLQTPDVATAPADEPPVAEETHSLETEVARYEFSNRGGGIQRAVLLQHLAEEGEQVVLNRTSDMPIGAVSTDPEQWQVEAFAMEAGQNAVVFRGATGALQLTKRFYFNEEREDEHAIDLELEFHNPGDTAAASGDIFVHLGSAMAIHADDLPAYTSFDWYRDGDLEDISVSWFQTGSFLGMQYRDARPVYTAEGGGIEWAAVKNQYFTTLATVLSGEARAVRAMRLPAQHEDGELYAIQGALGFAGFNVEPQGSRTIALRLYIGPKEFRRLQKFDKGQAEIMQFGFFKPVSIFLLKMMNWLQSKLGFYAAAICVMTLIIKTAMWPLQNAATKSMRKMQALQPKMTELREKYKDDPTRMNQELMKLYKDYGINPFGGCLPMLIQITIFFGFYRMLGVAPELRNSSFLWINDLSQPDTVLHVFGFPINVLPLLMALTMVWQMKITPKSGDPVQQRIFMFVPLIFVVFCYNFASALALYWTVQNLFSIVQLYATRNQEIPALRKKEPAAASIKSPKRKKR